MIKAHVEAAYVMGEPFSKKGDFDFSTFKHGERMAEQGQVMVVVLLYFQNNASLVNIPFDGQFVAFVGCQRCF